MRLLWLSASFAAGILAGNLVPVPWESAAAFTGACLAALGLARLRRWPLLPLAALLFFSLGLVRAGAAPPDPSPLATYHGS